MRSPAALLLALLCAACRTDSLTVSGTMAQGSGASEVFVVGGAQSAPVVADSFRLEPEPGDTLELHFARGDGEPARMRLVGAPRSGRLRLERVWISADGVAHPSRLHLEGGRVLTVNGLRMGDAASLPGRIQADGTVLSVAGEGDALLMRPSEASLPDLRVVITPGTRVRSAEGGPVEVGALERGDPLRVSGQGVEGYVVATEVVVPGGSR